MIAQAMIVGLGGAILSAGGALATGQPLLIVAGSYMAGGSLSMLAALINAGRHAPPPAGPAGPAGPDPRADVPSSRTGPTGSPTPC